MSLFMVEWKSVDPKISTSSFLAGAFPLPPAVKVIASVHVIDKPLGYLLLDCTAEEIYAAILALPPNVLEIITHAVVDDNTAKKGLEKRHSAYKVK